MIEKSIPHAMAVALIITSTPCAAVEPLAATPMSRETIAAQPAATVASPKEQVPAAAAKPATTASSTTVSDSDLGKLRGGDGTMVITNQTLNEVTSGNVINGNYSAGNINVSDSALSNFNGLGNIIINTGAQVSLQSGMSVTINTTP